MSDRPRQRRTVSWGDLDHVRDKMLPWPDPRPEREPEEKATGKFALRLSARDRDQLERLRAKFGVLTLSKTIKYVIRATHKKHCTDENED
jgi:hypothetical protein